MRPLGFIIVFFLFLTSCVTSPQKLTGKIVGVESFLEEQGAIELFFCPEENCEEALLSALEQASVSLHCALYDIGLPSIQNILKQKAQTIEVLVVTDDDNIKKFNESFVRADKYGLMHNKFCIIDGEKVTTGSMNPTLNDAHKNNNNFLIFSSKIISQEYESEFREL